VPESQELMILFSGLSEMYFIDIQEDAITRNRELDSERFSGEAVC
jgi:hypothetical protein